MTTNPMTAETPATTAGQGSSSDVHLELLGEIRMAAPCHMRWEDLDGDGVIRHCRECDLNVHNFAEMTPEAIAEIVSNTKGRLCAAFYRRPDGTMLLENCPVGLRALRRRTARTLARVGAAVGLLLTCGIALGRTNEDRAARLRCFQPFAAMCDWVAGTPLAPVPGRMAMGRMCVRPAAAPPTPAPSPPAPSGPLGR